MEKMTPPTLGKRFAAELLGTYLLVTLLIVAYFMTVLSGGNSLLYGITYGADLTVLITVFRPWSYQFNPVVSIMAFLMKGQTLVDTGVAFLGQLLAAVLASRTVLGITNLVESVNAQVPTIEGSGVSNLTVTSLEGFGILLLLLVYVWGATKKDNDFFPILAGLSVIPGALLTVFVSGGALNPVRVLGPALFDTATLSTQWVYWVGPLVAAIVVAVVMGFLLKSDK